MRLTWGDTGWSWGVSRRKEAGCPGWALGPKSLCFEEEIGLFFLKYCIYLFMRDTQREKQRHRQREKQAPCRDPLGPGPELNEGRCSTAEPPRHPEEIGLDPANS